MRVIFTIQGDAEMSARFRQAPDEVNQRLLKTLNQLGLKLQAAVKRDKLSGQVLKNRTGTLRRSINIKLATASDMSVSVGTNVKYAAVHEYGFHGAVSVKAHLRTVRKVFGRPVAPTVQNVKTHSRQMNLPERSFLRSALREMEPEIQDKLRGAVMAGLK